MKSKLWVILTLVIIVSMLLASCQPAAPKEPAAPPAEPTATTEAKAAAPTEAPKAAEPTAAPTAAPTATEYVLLKVKEG